MYIVRVAKWMHTSARQGECSAQTTGISQCRRPRSGETHIGFKPAMVQAAVSAPFAWKR
jgi:hypothetical protein